MTENKDSVISDGLMDEHFKENGNKVSSMESGSTPTKRASRVRACGTLAKD